jgi:hypothetical protein
MDEYGRLIPSSRKFPSSANGNGFKSLADYIHSKGLKFGIHIIRGIPWQAVEQDAPIKGTEYTAKEIITDANPCRWFHGMNSIDLEKPGAQEYYNSILELYAAWGVDYIKADDLLRDPYKTKEIEAISKAVRNSGRPIVLSLSAGPMPVEKTGHLRQNCNLWRISLDFWDDWSYLLNAFEKCRTWQDYVIPGHWPDCDMLPLGKLRINGNDGLLAKRIGVPRGKMVNEYSRFSNDEKYTLLTLWSIFRSPLMMGGDLLQLDEFTYRIITNEEVLAVNQNSLNNHELRADEHEIVWVADDPVTGGKYLAVFNLNGDIPINSRIHWNELGISGAYTVRSLWKKEDLGKYSDGFEVKINPHGCGLYKISAEI